MSTEPHVETAEILLVDDSPLDVRLSREGIEASGIAARINIVNDGADALEFLRRTGRFAMAPRPNLVLLDLNMPRVGGSEVLAAIKSDAGLRRIPVVVFSTSREEGEVRRTYDLHANCFITKPIDVDAFLEKVRSACIFWLSTARRPSVA